MPSDTPNFAAWNTQTLAQFAEEAYHKLRLQEETIMLLQQDLKTAIAANRKLIVERDTDDWK